MFEAVDSDWLETDRYGLGIGEITSLMGRQPSPCGAAWGHLGFSVGYTRDRACRAEDGETPGRRSARTGVREATATQEAFFDAAGRLAWGASTAATSAA